eukprot:1188892-Prorocentrum_minimum.AAC.2
MRVPFPWVGEVGSSEVVFGFDTTLTLRTAKCRTAVSTVFGNDVMIGPRVGSARGTAIGSNCIGSQSKSFVYSDEREAGASPLLQ